ncbi:MAG: tRNA (adenosine(37)-N6)-threonylcarbamoyltransferase complex ATPase subunit type 1 TsaE [Christensenellales bacterium]
MIKTFISNSLKDTEKIAKELSKIIQRGDCVLLNGEIGAGKTTFTQFLLKNYGIKSAVSSPTFTLLNVYDADFPIYHFDMYRISSFEELAELGFEDYIFSANSPYVITGLTLIEWGENIKDALPKNAIKLNIEKIGENSRKFEFIKDE